MYVMIFTKRGTWRVTVLQLTPVQDNGMEIVRWAAAAAGKVNIEALLQSRVVDADAFALLRHDVAVEDTGGGGGGWFIHARSSLNTSIASPPLKPTTCTRHSIGNTVVISNVQSAAEINAFGALANVVATAAVSQR